MGGVDEATADGQRRDVHGAGAEEVQRDDRAGDVDDRVHRADLVEVHRLHRGAVDARLGLGQPAKDARGSGHDRR